MFVSHTGFGGVAYAMAIICLRLQSEGKLSSLPLTKSGNQDLLSSNEAREKGDYRDILSLTRVLVHGPESKSDVDIVIERYAAHFWIKMPKKLMYLRSNIFCCYKGVLELGILEMTFCSIVRNLRRFKGMMMIIKHTSWTWVSKH